MSKYINKGISFKLGSTAVGSITSIGGIEISADEEETTSVCDTAGYRSFMPTFRDAGNIDLEGLYDDAESENFDALADIKESDTPTTFTIQYPGNAKWTGSCYVSKFKFGETGVGSLMKWSASLRIIGQPTLTLTAPTPGSGG